MGGHPWEEVHAFRAFPVGASQEGACQVGASLAEAPYQEGVPFQVVDHSWGQMGAVRMVVLLVEVSCQVVGVHACLEAGGLSSQEVEGHGIGEVVQEVLCEMEVVALGHVEILGLCLVQT